MQIVDLWKFCRRGLRYWWRWGLMGEEVREDEDEDEDEGEGWDGCKRMLRSLGC